MKSENLSTGNALIDNELDIRGLFRLLWQGKVWPIAFGLLFAVVALGYSYLVKQEWSATAITDKPTVNMLGGIIRSSNSCVTSTPGLFPLLSQSNRLFRLMLMMNSSCN